MEAQTQLRDVKTAVTTLFQNASLPERAILRQEGEYWTVGYGANAFRLKDTKGLAYLAHLLRHPAAEFHVLDLVGGVAGQREDDETNQSVHGLPHGEQDLEKAGIHIGGLGDAGEMLDEQAKAAYRRRLSGLREELGEEKEAGGVSFGTSPTEHQQDDQVGSGKDRAERCPAGRYLLALRQDGHLLLLPARPRSSDWVGIRCYRANRASKLK